MANYKILQLAGVLNSLFFIRTVFNFTIFSIFCQGFYFHFVEKGAAISDELNLIYTEFPGIPSKTAEFSI